MGKTFNGGFSRSISDGLFKIDQFLGLGQAGTTMDRSFELFPKWLPMKNISVERWDIQLWEFGGLVTGGSCGFSSARSVRAEQLLDKVRAVEMEFLEVCMLSNQDVVVR